MKRLGSFFLFLSLLIFGCASRDTDLPLSTTQAGVDLPPEWTSIASKTLVPPLTITLTPGPTSTVTQTPTATTFPTPLAPLSAEGPWLLGDTGRQSVAMNPDGSGLTALDVYSQWSSVTGWLVAHGSKDQHRHSDFSLMLVRLPSAAPVRTIRLLSDELAAKIEESEAWNLDTAADVYQAILTEGQTAFWSSDGRYLAFIAAIDGPSADLYVYDTQQDQVRRLTDGPNQAVIMDWSPDGRWIIHAEVTDFESYEGMSPIPLGFQAVWAAFVDGSIVKRLYDVYGGPEILTAWRAPNVFVAYSTSFLGRANNLRSVDVNSGRVFSISDRDITAVAADLRTGAVSYVVVPDEMGLGEHGLFVAPVGGHAAIQVSIGEDIIPERIEWFPETGLFYAQVGHGSIAFDSSGELLMYLEDELIPVPSPDGQWLAFRTRQGSATNPGLRLYTSSGEFIRELSSERVTGLIWHPDSTGIYYNVRVPDGDGYFMRLMYVPVPEGEPSIVHPEPGASFFAWVQP